MTTELATTAEHGVATINYTREQIELLKRTICVGATDDELQLFLMRVKVTGLDPFAKQIYAVKRKSKSGESKMTIQTGIDGYRAMAIRSREADGQEGPYWCGEDGIWKEVWLDREKPPFASKVVVYRKGHARGYVGIAHMAEYYQAAGGMWDNLPVTMIAKVAETIALRKAFPQELSGIYTDDEMPAETYPTKQPQREPPKPEEFKLETDRTGASWEWCIKNINSAEGTAYTPSTKYSEVAPAHLHSLLAHLKTCPDRKQPTTIHPANAENADFAKADILTLDQWAERLEVSQTISEATGTWAKVPAVHREALTLTFDAVLKKFEKQGK